MSEKKRGALQSTAKTARTEDTVVRHVQPIGSDGEVAPAGTSTSNAQFVQNTRLNPDWAHISNEQPFNAQAADGSSTGYDVSSYKSLGFRLTDAICDGVLTITDSDGAPLMFTVDGILKSSHTCPASGTNKHTCKIVNGNPDQTIYVLTGRTTGSITIDTLYQ